MYHQVGEFARPKAHRATFCHIRRFKSQMAYLHSFGYNVISLDNALNTLFSDGTLSKHSVVLTFDDGYQNFNDYAFPVLRKYGFPATVFLISNLIGKNAQWLADDGHYAPLLMDRPTIRKLITENISFGSHTQSHLSLTHISPDQMAEEIFNSKSDLEELLGEKIEDFCYPNGDFNDNAIAAVQEAGYRCALSCIRGSATSSDNRFVLPRKAISFGDSLAGYLWKLHVKHKKKLAKQNGTSDL